MRFPRRAEEVKFQEMCYGEEVTEKTLLCWCGRTDQSDLSSDRECGGSFPRNGLFNLKNSYDVTVMKHMVHIYKQRARQDAFFFLKIEFRGCCGFVL